MLKPCATRPRRRADRPYGLAIGEELRRREKTRSESRPAADIAASCFSTRDRIEASPLSCRIEGPKQSGALPPAYSIESAEQDGLIDCVRSQAKKVSDQDQ